MNPKGETGCHYHPDCLTCPFAECIYEKGRSPRLQKKPERDAEIIRLYSSGQMKPKALGVKFDLSRETVQHIVRGHKNNG